MARKRRRAKKQAAFSEQSVPGVTLRHTLRGHTGVVCRIAWSPDGKWLASPSYDETIRIWDANTGELVRTLKGHMGAVFCVAWSPDGQKLASTASDKTLRLWNPESGESVWTLRGHSSAVYGVAWSPDGRMIASTSDDKTMRLWDADTGQGRRTLAIRSELVTGQGRRTLAKHSEPVTGLAWSPDGRMLASAAEHNMVRLWGADTGNSLRTLEGHGGHVFDVAWSPGTRSRRLASASLDKTIHIWDAATGLTTNVLEGHTCAVVCVAFSSDARLLASKGAQKAEEDSDNTVRLWRCDTWQPVAVIPEPASNKWPPGVAYHPDTSLLATVGSDPDAKWSHDGKENQRDSLIHLWKLDLAVLLGEAEGVPTPARVRPDIEGVQHTTAKIVLVGDSGVGKTGLGWRLSHGEFKHHPSTHGQQFWVLDQMEARRSDGTRCEAVLWDLAGQPDYRLIHALFLDDADLALVVFDPTNSRDPLGGAEYWLEQLPPNCPKILVAARVDRGSSTLTPDELDAFCRQREIAGGFVETSAMKGTGLDELLERMKAGIDWDAKTAVTTTETFKRIKDFVLDLKEDRSGRQVLYTPAELRRQLEASDPGWRFSEGEMMTAVERLASHGYVRVLQTSDGQQRILLVPELLNNLAASFILEARRNPKGLGALEEQRILSGDYRFSELDALSDTDRRLMLDATIVAFLENRLSYRCFREILGQTRLLVFPELMNLKKPQTDERPTEEGVSYAVSGASENTYASLVVLLGYTNAFLRTNQWRNQARYEFQKALICGFRQAEGRDGELDFVLVYGPDVGKPVRTLFQGLFESFLARQKVTVRRFEPVDCSQCGRRLDRSVMRERLARGRSFAFCNECGTRLPLPAADEPLRLTQDVKNKVERLHEFAEQRAEFEQAVFQLHRFVEQGEFTPPTCFLSYAWGVPEHERWVAQLAEDLQKGGLEVVFDRMDNPWFGQDVARFVDRVSACDRVLIVGTPLYLKKYENRLSETGSVVAAEMDQVGQRMLGTEEQKESVIPLLLSGNVADALPPSLRGRVYADFRETDAYFVTAFELLLSLYRIRFDHEAVVGWHRKLAQASERQPARPDEPERV